MFPYRKALFREMIYFFIMCIVMPALLLLIVDSDLIFLVIGFLIFVISGCIIVSLPVFYEYLDYKNFRVIKDKIIYYDMKYSYGIPYQDPINSVYSDINENVFRVLLKGKSENHFHRVSFRCIVTESRYDLIRKILPEKQGRLKKRRMVKDDIDKVAISSEENRNVYPLIVTYTGFNHYLLAIDLVDGIKYPKGFAESIEKINHMF